MAYGLQMNLMLDVTAFGTFRTKKFPARGQVIKKRAHLDLRSRRFTAIAHNVKLAAINDNFGSCDRVRLARSQAKSRDAGDAWQGFAAKSQRGHRFKISSRPDLARGMPLQGKERVIAIHAAAVIDYANQRNSPATNDDVDFARAGVDAVLDQFLHHRRRALHDFAGSYLAGYRLRQQSNLTHLVFQILNSTFAIAKKNNKRMEIRNPSHKIALSC